MFVTKLDGESYSKFIKRLRKDITLKKVSKENEIKYVCKENGVYDDLLIQKFVSISTEDYNCMLKDLESIPDELISKSDFFMELISKYIDDGGNDYARIKPLKDAHEDAEKELGNYVRKKICHTEEDVYKKLIFFQGGEINVGAVRNIQ